MKGPSGRPLKPGDSLRGSSAPENRDRKDRGSCQWTLAELVAVPAMMAGPTTAVVPLEILLDRLHDCSFWINTT